MPLHLPTPFPPIYEEWRDQFRGVRETLEQAAEESPDAWLNRGVIHFLQGEPLVAATCFEKARKLAPEDSAIQLRALGYDYLAELFRNIGSPAGFALYKLSVQSEWDISARSKVYEAARAELIPQVSHPSVLLEAQLL